MSNKKLQQIIEYFEYEEGYDKDEIIIDILHEIKELNDYSADEIELKWDNKHLMNLEDFADEYYNKIIKGVCNVIKSYQEENKYNIIDKIFG